MNNGTPPPLVAPTGAPLVGSERCGNCRFRRLVSAAEANPRFQCKRHPPKVTSFIVGQEDGHFKFHHVMMRPIITEDDWCGDWKAWGKKEDE